MFGRISFVNLGALDGVVIGATILQAGSVISDRLVVPSRLEIIIKLGFRDSEGHHTFVCVVLHIVGLDGCLKRI